MFTLFTLGGDNNADHRSNKDINIEEEEDFA